MQFRKFISSLSFSAYFKQEKFLSRPKNNKYERLTIKQIELSSLPMLCKIKSRFLIFQFYSFQISQDNKRLLLSSQKAYAYYNSVSHWYCPLPTDMQHEQVQGSSYKIQRSAIQPSSGKSEEKIDSLCMANCFGSIKSHDSKLLCRQSKIIIKIQFIITI